MMEYICMEGLVVLLTQRVYYLLSKTSYLNSLHHHHTLDPHQHHHLLKMVSLDLEIIINIVHRLNMRMV